MVKESGQKTLKEKLRDVVVVTTIAAMGIGDAYRMMTVRYEPWTPSEAWKEYEDKRNDFVYFGRFGPGGYIPKSEEGRDGREWLKQIKN